jgi:thymidylate synthase ThyX
VIYARVIADSISPTGSRLTTCEVRFHRFILPEVLTHRAFSRNTASNRAIPTSKLIQQVRENPAYPLEYGANQAGMQAGVPFNASQTRTANIVWRKASEDAADRAEALLAMGVHKQVVNRLLEPFLWTTQIISSTEAGWTNFFDQRISPLAQPEIQDLAVCIQDAMGVSTPTKLGYGQWHTPYIRDDEECSLTAQGVCEKISAARCARVSYLTHDGKRDVNKDLDLYQKLITADPPHWSPLEHVATPDWVIPQRSPVGNFDGWSQLRHLPECQ